MEIKIAETNSREEFRLLKTLPKEIWLMVFDKLEDSTQCHQLSNNFAFFKTLLSPALHKLLFPSVLTKFYDWYKIKRTPFMRFDSYGIENKAILPLRRVTTLLRKSVDLLIQERTYSLNFSYEINYELDGGSNFCYSFNSVKQLQLFVEHFESTHSAKQANPFIVGRVCFHCYDREPNLELFLEAALTLLRKYGNHIHSCTMDIFFENLSTCCGWIQKALRLLPNLVVFCSNIMLSPWNTDEVLWNEYAPPQFEKLQFLKIQNMPSALCSMLNLKNIPIKKLEIQGESYPKLHQQILPLLCTAKELSFTCNIDEFGIYEKLKPLASNKVLVKPELDLREQNVQPCTIFNFLNESAFAKQLKELRLWVTDSETGDGLSCSLVLMNLEILNIHVGSRIMCLDFSLPMRATLRKLSIWKDVRLRNAEEEYTKIESKGGIKFWTWRNQLYKSNVWTIFPKLDKPKYICLNDRRVRAKLASSSYSLCCTREKLIRFATA